MPSKDDDDPASTKDVVTKRQKQLLNREEMDLNLIAESLGGYVLNEFVQGDSVGVDPITGAVISTVGGGINLLGQGIALATGVGANVLKSLYKPKPGEIKPVPDKDKKKKPGEQEPDEKNKPGEEEQEPERDGEEESDTKGDSKKRVNKPPAKTGSPSNTGSGQRVQDPKTVAVPLPLKTGNKPPTAQQNKNKKKKPGGKFKISPPSYGGKIGRRANPQ